MKTKSLLLLALLLISILSCSQGFIKLPESKIDSDKLNFAQTFAENYMNASVNGNYYQFKDEAIEQLKNSLTEENQKAVYNQLVSQFGEYLSMEYAETWVDTNDSGTTIFRFKAKFSKSTSVLEIRVVINSDNKIAGFWIKPWSDLLG